MCRHLGSVAILASWTFGSCTLKLLSRDGRASFRECLKVIRGKLARNIRAEEPAAAVP